MSVVRNSPPGSLPRGKRFGRYEVVSLLGAGGMGQVYRVRDTVLSRDVALKILTSEAGRDSARFRRFQMEAQASAALSHPNVVSIYDVGEEGGIPYIVSELVEGTTLAAALARGPFPTKRLLDLTVGMAEGLSAAHAAGIVHRDLKPANVLLTAGGVPKIADFGLAKHFRPSSDSEGSHLSTLPEERTTEGTILGTLGYMSPEQAKGEPADFRSDQFSFGAILYEMATGKKAFQRSSSVQTLAAIVQEEPEPIAAQNSGVPAPIRWIVERCLAKDPKSRYASTEDLARDLASLRDHVSEVGSGESAGPALKRSRLRRREFVAWTAAALFAAVAAALFLRRPTAAPPLRRHAYLVPPAGTEFTNQGAALAVSPDGQRIVFGTRNAEGKMLLFLRAFAEADAHPLPGTEDASFPFWSPDSRAVGFFSQQRQQPGGGKLKRIGVLDGSALVICDAPEARGGSWGADDIILFGNLNGPLYRVSAAGGQPSVATRLDSTRREADHRWPHFLPDGRRFLFVARQRDGSLALEAGSFDAPNAKVLGKVESGVAYAPPGYLLSAMNDRTLVAEPFDLDGLRLLGSRVPVAEQVGRWAAFSVSRTGVLAYLAMVQAEPRKFVWFDRSGRQLESFGPAKVYEDVALSPDGTRLVTGATDPRTDTSDLWLHDFARGTTTRFTFDPASEESPLWSPDGRQIAFGSNRKGPRGLYLKAASGTAPETLLLESDNDRYPDDWSPDGRFLLYENSTSNGKWGLWALPMTGERKPFPVTQTPFREEHGRFSPDGRLIAYLSNESGRNEVYVQAFPQAVERWQVSTGGAREPRWRRDGKELFYISGDNQLMSVATETRPVFTAAAPRPLFRVGPAAMIVAEPCVMVPCATSPYNVAPDGQRFLFIVSEREAGRPPINLVFNWLPESKR